MPRKFKERIKKLGLPPGSSVYLGEKKGEAKIGITTYDKENFKEETLKEFPDCSSLKELNGNAWLEIIGIHEVETVEKIGKCFGLHPLVIEDILETDQRPKIEEFEDYLFTTFKVFHIAKKGDDLEPEQISLILLPNSLYFFILDKLGEGLENLEEKAITSPVPQTIQSIDHIFNLRETPETMREILASILDIYLSSVGIRLNEVMKVHTIIGTIFMPLTFIVGIYGMNLKNMPEVNWPWTYPIVWAVIIITAGSMYYYYFKRKGWL
ncbi:hypothetical protein H5T88_03740 [bacterium]|nr:hypothetical protein [bacterium]